MKILVLSDVNSPHTIKWVESLVESSIEISLYSLAAPKNDWFSKLGVTVTSLAVSAKIQLQKRVNQKYRYIKGVAQVKTIIKVFSPDIVHAHYATSYGLIGRLAGFRPFVVSFWGSDIQDFPHRSWLHKKLLAYVISKNTTICVTSKVMQKEVQLHFKKKSNYIPFGIKLHSFQKKKHTSSNNIYTIGTVKALEDVYGIDILIESYAFYAKNAEITSQLFIYGKGSKLEELKLLTRQLNIENQVFFKGYVQKNEVSLAYLDLDLFVALSHRESFGVSVLEASSSGLPVIVSSASGFKEVIDDGITGFSISNDNYEALAEKYAFFENSNNRNQFGANGSRFVEENFSFKENLRSQINLYKTILNK